MATAKRKARSEETAPEAAPAAPEPRTKPKPRPKGRARPKPPEWNHVVDCPTPGVDAILDIVDGIRPRPKPKDLGNWCPWIEHAHFPRLDLKGPIDGGGRIEIELRIYTERKWRTLCAEFGDDPILDRGDRRLIEVDRAKCPGCPFRYFWRSAHRIRRFGLVLVVEYYPERPPITVPGPRWKPRVRRRAAEEE